MSSQSKRQRSFCFLIISFCLVIANSSIFLAQDFRGMITGVVTDPSGAAIAGAQIKVTNEATGTSTSTTTNEEGNYSVLYLTPGRYMLLVETTGFKRLDRQNVEVRVGDKLALDLTLEPGGVQETVTITGNSTPLLETATASAGQVVDQRRISELPLADGNPFILSRLAPGVVSTNNLKFTRPFDNNGTSSFVTNGAPGGNEFTLDGIPNSKDQLGRVAFVPPADAVQEFKVVTTSFDAQQGHSAGANVNVTLKSGTNSLHGTLYEFVRNDALSANDFFLNRAGRPRAALRYNRYGGTVGGPIILPRFGEGGPAVINGRNRSFFFFSYEGLKDNFPTPTFYTVPTLAERNGDFSALLPLGIQIYDPFSARRLPNGRIQRTPFQNNIIPANRISPIGRAYLQYYPLPNQPGDSFGRNNFLSPNPSTDNFNSESVRIDHNFSDRHRIFGRYSHNKRIVTSDNYAGIINGAQPTTGAGLRRNDNASLDDVYTLSPTTILNFRLGFSRFFERASTGTIGSPAALGFSPGTLALFGDASYFPEFDISNFSTLGGPPGDVTAHYIYTGEAIATKISGDHTFRVGYNFRLYRENFSSPGSLEGVYQFGSDFTRGPLDTSPAASIGQELAAVLLGLPTGGAIDRNAARSNQAPYHGIFFQDDWKATRKLTLNLGLRYEYEGATTERYNRNIRGFDTTRSSPIEAAARTAYSAKPISEIAAENFRVRGGLLFASKNNRGFWEPDKNNIQPRLGFAYQWNEKTVLRGGFGIYTVPFIIDAIQQPGFSQSTNLVPTLDAGLTFRATLANPFPEGVVEPPGATQGLSTFIGRDLTFFPLQRKNPQSQRFEFSAERELPGQWMVEAAYIRNYSYDLTSTTDILNAVPRQYLSTSAVRDQPTINFLTANVISPFAGLAPGTSLNGSTVQRQQLLRPFPQFLNIRTQRYDGSSIYHSGQFRAEKRFAQGYTLQASYTWSKLIERISFRNPQDTDYERRISGNDVPHRVVVSGIYELPFGRGRAFGRDVNRIVDAFLGGIQVQGIYQYQSGRPIGLGNVYYDGDPSQLRANITGETIDNTFDKSGFYFHDAAVQTNGVDDPVKQRNDPRIRLANNIRTLATFFPSFRGQPLNLWDLSVIKNVSVTEAAKLQLRAEFLNAFNHPQFNNPNMTTTSSSFGRVTSQGNLPRSIQLGIKLIF